ncbi:unnamed protein product, partial [Dovyalis caffra]
HLHDMGFTFLASTSTPKFDFASRLLSLPPLFFSIQYSYMLLQMSLARRNYLLQQVLYFRAYDLVFVALFIFEAIVIAPSLLPQIDLVEYLLAYYVLCFATDLGES